MSARSSKIKPPAMVSAPVLKCRSFIKTTPATSINKATTVAVTTAFLATWRCKLLSAFAVAPR